MTAISAADKRDNLSFAAAELSRLMRVKADAEPQRGPQARSVRVARSASVEFSAARMHSACVNPAARARVTTSGKSLTNASSAKMAMGVDHIAEWYSRIGD